MLLKLFSMAWWHWCVCALDGTIDQQPFELLWLEGCRFDFHLLLRNFLSLQKSRRANKNYYDRFFSSHICYISPAVNTQRKILRLTTPQPFEKPFGDWSSNSWATWNSIRCILYRHYLHYTTALYILWNTFIIETYFNIFLLYVHFYWNCNETWSGL